MLLQRICWNEHQWKRPSGLPKDEGYPKAERFGWDEWNFNLEDAFEGYVYGHNPYSPSLDKRPPSQTICVAFWTKCPETREVFLIGFYEAAEWTSPDQSKQFDNWLVEAGNSGKWARRKRELVSVTGFPKKKINAEFQPEGHVWKLRCPVGEVRLLDHAVLLPKELVVKHQRFARPRFWRGGNTASDLLTRCAALTATFGRRQLGYQRVTSSSTSNIDQNEEKLREEFIRFLGSQPQRFNKIQREKQHADVIFRSNGESSIAELKSVFSYPSLDHALRTGLGQLLSYNYARGRTPATHWWLVLDQEPDSESRKFMTRVAKTHNMPLWIAYKDEVSFTVWRVSQTRHSTR